MYVFTCIYIVHYPCICMLFYTLLYLWTISVGILWDFYPILVLAVRIPSAPRTLQSEFDEPSVETPQFFAGKTSRALSLRLWVQPGPQISKTITCMSANPCNYITNKNKYTEAIVQIYWKYHAQWNLQSGIMFALGFVSFKTARISITRIRSLG